MLTVPISLERLNAVETVYDEAGVRIKAVDMVVGSDKMEGEVECNDDAASASCRR